MAVVRVSTARSCGTLLRTAAPLPPPLLLRRGAARRTQARKQLVDLIDSVRALAAWGDATVPRSADVVACSGRQSCSPAGVRLRARVARPQKRGKKALVLDPAISGSLTLLDSGLSELLTEHGIAKCVVVCKGCDAQHARLARADAMHAGGWGRGKSQAARHNTALQHSAASPRRAHAHVQAAVPGAAPPG